MENPFRMNNPETLETVGTQDTGGRKTKQKAQQRKLKRWARQTTQRTGMSNYTGIIDIVHTFSRKTVN